MAVKKLDNLPVHIPSNGRWPAMDVFVNWRCVASTNVDRVGWDKDGNMYVMYRGNNAIYLYLQVGRQKIVAAAYSESVGRFINYKIKGHYRVEKIVPA